MATKSNKFNHSHFEGAEIERYLEEICESLNIKILPNPRRLALVALYLALVDVFAVSQCHFKTTKLQLLDSLLQENKSGWGPRMIYSSW